MLSIWAQWLPFSGVVVLLITVVSIAVAGWFTVVRRRFDPIGRSIEQIRAQENRQLALLGTLVTALSRQGVVSREEFAGIIQSFVSLDEAPAVPNNPLTSDDLQRINHYIDLARAGGPFTPEQVRDYRTLVDILEQEKPDDPDVWRWVALGALLLGMYLPSKDQ